MTKNISKEMTRVLAIEIEALLGAAQEKVFCLEHRSGKQNLHLNELAGSIERGMELISLVTNPEHAHHL